ncbi:MAG: GTPase ObgE [Paludibacteraceae bacterium]|nr:GTPase ObgE [Paludibacteraceae bacterium]MDD6747939.1 GTPase ObgE [Paludibacteraceae bacterium]MDY5651173.1 GTPase ObgE [Paludibacteraceae bacterium]
MAANFIDYVKIYCRSGKGGAGCMHLHRAKYLPKGGPDGGDGGKGGSVILRGNRNLWTLLHLKYQKHIMATDGGKGGQSRSFGKDGEDKIIEVPCGTVVYDGETGEYICEVKEHKEQVVLLKGGRGGLGNWHFRTATNQAPRYAQPGEPAQERTVIMQLKVLADVGLVGFPNAGKSTLLSVVSAAKPEIADYPFTTLTPQLGIVSYRDGRSFCMADIPGIIEGAAEGKGLGLRFLRHIERNAVLLFMVPATSKDIIAEYEILLHELEKYNPELLTKARILAVTKCDLPRVDEEGKELPAIDYKKLSKKLGIEVLPISSIAGLGIDELKDALWTELNKEQNQVIEISHAPIDITRIESEEPEAMEEAEEEGTIYLNEVEEEWDLDKYKGIGWDTE